MSKVQGDLRQTVSRLSDIARSYVKILETRHPSIKPSKFRKGRVCDFFVDRPIKRGPITDQLPLIEIHIVRTSMQALWTGLE